MTSAVLRNTNAIAKYSNRANIRKFYIVFRVSSTHAKGCNKSSTQHTIVCQQVCHVCQVSGRGTKLCTQV